jgi:hypothetical protein
MDKIVEDATAASTHEVSRNTGALTDSTSTSVTFLAVADERSEIKVLFTDKAGASKSVWFNLSTGAVGTETNGTGRIETLAGSIYRCEAVFDSASGGTTPNVKFQLGSGSETASYNGDGASGLHVWGVQIEIDQPFASSYIPTTVYNLSPDGYLDLPGSASNYASSPDAAALDITGDIDIRARIAADDYTPAAVQGVTGKWTSTGDERSYRLRISTDGKIQLSWSTDGTAGNTVTVSSSVASGVTNAATKWVRATLDVSSGNVNFYTSDDGENWTLLGAADQGGAGATSIYSSTAILEVGSTDAGGQANFAGQIYRLQVYDGIAGTLAFDADFQDTSTHGATRKTVTEKSSNAATVTVFSTSAAATRVADLLYFPLPAAIATPKEETLYASFREGGTILVTGGRPLHIGSATASADARARMEESSGNYQFGHDNGTADVTATQAAAPSVGQETELRGELGSDGAVLCGQSIAGATETNVDDATANALQSAWAAERLYVNSGGSTLTGFGSYREVILTRRTRTLEHLRKVG